MREKQVKNKQNVCENKQINETYYRKRKEKRDWNEKNLRKKNYATYLTRQQKTIIRPKNVMRYSKSAETTQNEKKNRNY